MPDPKRENRAATADAPVQRRRRPDARTRYGLRPVPAAAGLRLLGQGPRRTGAALGRALPGPPARGGRNPGGHAPRRDHGGRRPAPRHGGGFAHHGRGAPATLRRGRGLPGRRAHEDRPDRVQLGPGEAGGELPQDADRDVQGHPHPADQAGRSPAQHADPRVHGRGQVAAHRPGDPGHLRAAGPPARHPLDEAGARGARLPRAESRRGARARGAAPLQAPDPPGLHRGGDRRPLEAAVGRRACGPR